jgi:hypothetical protein
LTFRSWPVGSDYSHFCWNHHAWKKRSIIVAAYIPCQTCNYPCVITQKFDHDPTHDELDRHVFHASCDNCGERQTRVGHEAFKRTIVEWELEIRTPRRDELPPSE